MTGNILTKRFNQIDKIDIALIGNNQSNNIKLINFWLSLNNETLISFDIYSKIMWMSQFTPLQINIQELSPMNNFKPIIERNNNFNAVVYYLTTESEIYSIDSLSNEIKQFIDLHTYKIILIQSDNDTLINSVKDHQIINGFDGITLNILEKITIKAYDSFRLTSDNFINAYTEPNMIEMESVYSNKNNSKDSLDSTGTVTADCCLII